VDRRSLNRDHYQPVVHRKRGEGLREEGGKGKEILPSSLGMGEKVLGRDHRQCHRHWERRGHALAEKNLGKGKRAFIIHAFETKGGLESGLKTEGDSRVKEKEAYSL